ncbi:peptidase M48 [Hypericibacter adhaerens]|uniref:Peptidase M48 n=1 Tax=Hypericibacter adhaerens TaxID=2602016 RepID=A0A5J6N5A9_9PROT|nr:site-2 protease family protein [Hypericibacter adhaerens]QEX22116.1 peptidase M48 [Hypericibacter adhaerens]
MGGGFNIQDFLFQVSIWTIPFLTAITLHEAAHGFVAYRFGDDTAKRMGRLSLTPLRHVDPFGTIILPAMLLLATHGQFAFGSAKPVPVNFGRLKPLRPGIVAVAAAGPATNLLLAFISALLGHVIPFLPASMSEWAGNVLGASMLLNLWLAVFNMLPVPPLDGGRVAVALLPRPLAARLAGTERFGILIILLLIVVLPYVGRQIGVDLAFVSRFIFVVVEWLWNLVAMAAGLH